MTSPANIPPTPPKVQALHRRIVVLRARMGFGIYVLARDRMENNAEQIARELGHLLLDIGQTFPQIDAETIAADAQTTIFQQILSGKCYALYDPFLRQPFVLEAKKRAQVRPRRNREDVPSREFEDCTEADEVGTSNLGLPLEAELGFLQLYGELGERLACQEPMLPMLDRWIATVKGPWVPDLVKEEFDRGGSNQTLVQIRNRYYRLREALFQQIHDVFKEWIHVNKKWIQMWAKMRKVHLPSNLPEDTAQFVIILIRELQPPPSAAALTHDAESIESCRPPDPDAERLRWLRGRQRDLMRDRAACCADRPYLALLNAYAAGTPEVEILRELYGDVTEDAQQRRDADLDTLHNWYKEITRAALVTKKDAWPFYDRIPKIGTGVVARAAAKHPDCATRFQPILDASKDGVPFTSLPDKLGTSWGKLTERVLELKALVASRDNDPPYTSGRECKS